MKESNGLGIASMVLGIIGLLLSCLVIGIVPAIVGLILGIIAICQSSKVNGSAVAGVVCAIIAMIFCSLMIFSTIDSSDEDETEGKEVVSYEETLEEAEENKDAEKEVKEDDAKSSNQKTDKKEYNSSECIEITSTELISDYNDNQVKCDRAYDGKMLKVTGEVTSVGTDILDNVYVCLGSDTEFTFVGIQCYAKNKETEDLIAELKEGDIITVYGKGECGSLSFSLRNAEILSVGNSTSTSDEDVEGATTGEKNALKTARNYLKLSPFSYEGLVSQLEFEKYTHEEAVYAADNCGADWNEQAKKSAASYLDYSSFSRDGLIEQLEYEGFTHEQAVYGVEQNGY